MLTANRMQNWNAKSQQKASDGGVLSKKQKNNKERKFHEKRKKNKEKIPQNHLKQKKKQFPLAQISYSLNIYFRCPFVFIKIFDLYTYT